MTKAGFMDKTITLTVERHLKHQLYQKVRCAPSVQNCRADLSHSLLSTTPSPRSFWFTTNSTSSRLATAFRRFSAVRYQHASISASLTL